MKKIIPFLIGLVILFVGCQKNGLPVQISQNEQSTKTETKLPAKKVESSTVTTTAISTPSIGESDIKTPTVTETLTPTSEYITPKDIPAETYLQYQCSEFISTLAEWPESNGFLILDNRVVSNGRYQNDDFTLDMRLGQKHPINGQYEGGVYYTVSPDRKLLAYKNIILDGTDNVNREDLIISSVDGQRLKVIPWEDGWTGLSGWLNNQQIVVNISGLDSDESHGLKADTLLAIDLFTEERRILRPDFPQIYHTRPMYDWDQWSVTMYDPTLTRVVYLTEESEFVFALWDLNQEQRLAGLQAIFPPGYYTPIPRWSPDGSQFVVEAYQPDQVALELFLVSRDGQIKQLTHLYKYKEGRLASYSWSPDGRYLAAWLDLSSFREQNEVELVTIDTQTMQITDHCLRIKYAGKEYGSAPVAPIWSPNGDQLVVMEQYNKDRRRILMIDLTKKFAVQIAEDMEPVGWMIGP